MKKIDYSKLAPGMIIGTTHTIHPLGCIIRATEAGLRNTFSPAVASHVLAVCCEHDLYYGVEMTLPKIRQVDLCEYEGSQLGNHIVFVADPFKHDEGLRLRANIFLLKSHRAGVKYGLDGLLEFWGFGDGNQDKDKDGLLDRMICSELIRQMLSDAGYTYANSWNDKVSPYDIQKCYTNLGKLVKWWR